MEGGVERDATGGEGGVGYKHPDFPPDPSTDRSRCKLRAFGLHWIVWSEDCPRQ